MKQQKQQKQQGFTIIEVVLVLAIAGLIFLMVFIALPTLQRNQRDTTRRSDVSRFKAQINQYQANNKGAVPTATIAGNAFISKYMNNEWKDPSSGDTYTYVAFSSNDLSNLTQKGQWTYATNKKCDNEQFMDVSATVPATPRTYAIAMKLEGSGITCQDNQ